MLGFAGEQDSPAQENDFCEEQIETDVHGVVEENIEQNSHRQSRKGKFVWKMHIRR